MRGKKILSILLFLFIAVGTVGLPWAFAANVTGVITYDGEVPKFKEIKMDADPVCLTHHSGPVYPQMLTLGDNKTLGDVFVHISQGVPEKKYPVPEDAAVLDQKGCMYNPHILGIMVGQPLKVLNPDGTLHNVHAVTKENAEFNIAMPKFRKEITKVFDKPEFMLSMKCDVHPWMGAWITVLSHPFFDVTQDDGKYAIENLPAGEYTVQIWHEKLGTKEAQVTLSDGETKEINFTLFKPK